VKTLPNFWLELTRLACFHKLKSQQFIAGFFISVTNN